MKNLGLCQKACIGQSVYGHALNREILPLMCKEATEVVEVPENSTLLTAHILCQVYEMKWLHIVIPPLINVKVVCGNLFTHMILYNNQLTYDNYQKNRPPKDGKDILW